VWPADDQVPGGRDEERQVDAEQNPHAAMLEMKHEGVCGLPWPKGSYMNLIAGARRCGGAVINHTNRGKGLCANASLSTGHRFVT